MTRLITTFFLSTVMLGATAQAQDYPPCFDYASIMKGYFDDETGLIDFGQYVVGFAPDGPFNGEVAIVDSENNVLGRFPFWEEKKAEDGVFATVNAQNPAQVTITSPGVYVIVFLVEGKSVTRFPLILRENKSDDPFDPKTTYHFDGLWRTMAYVTMDERDGTQIPEFHLWTGGLDLAVGESRGAFQATLYRDGEVLAYSKRALGFIPSGHFEPQSVNLFHPHEERQAGTAPFFTMDDFPDGTYELRVTRQPDGAQMRSFKITIEGGKMKQLPRAELGYEPALDFVVPRVPKINTAVFEMREAIWLEEKR